MDLTSGWKSQKIKSNGKIWKSTDLRNSLWCFCKKEQEKKSMDYCLTNEWDGKKNRLHCNKFPFIELRNNLWENYGYIDTRKGEWVFDKNAIQKETEKQVERMSLCPLFRKEKILKLSKNVPEIVNPKRNINWGFIDNDRNIWFWREGKWHSQWESQSFPGIVMMIGVKYLEARDVSDLTINNNLVNIELKTSNVQSKVIHDGSTGKDRWFKTWWGIILIILFYPILVPYLVWIKTKWHLVIKIVITILVLSTII